MRWLVLDVHYLCHRAFHTSQNLTFKDKPTGVIFGFLKSITSLKDEFQTDNVVFCFEHRTLFRRDVYPPYKRKRHTETKTEEEIQIRKDFAIQISELRMRYLPKIGFKNIFAYRGMESDDTMAAIAANADPNDEIVLITADGDLLQCLRPNVTMYSPTQRKLHTVQSFESKYGIPPRKWAIVKAIAGCTSDEVEGIKGVGEATALKFLKKELKETTKAYQSIVSAEGKAIVRRNRSLVQLPYEGCPVPTLVQDKVDRAGWIEVCGMLGMKSIASHPPIATRKR